jgi:hypothetical protein
MKFGFELEAFVFDKEGQPCLVPAGLPYDECGWLVEVRSEPHDDPSKAIHLLQAETEKTIKQAEEKGYRLLFEPLFKIPRDLKVSAARRYGKGILQYRNVYGHETHKNKTEFATASLHISVTKEKFFTYYEHAGCKECGHKTLKEFKYQASVDHAKLIGHFDKVFKDEIKAAQRNPGFYEIKGDGRIEYRSLPNNVDLKKVAQELEKIKEYL